MCYSSLNLVNIKLPQRGSDWIISVEVPQNGYIKTILSLVVGRFLPTASVE